MEKWWHVFFGCFMWYGNNMKQHYAMDLSNVGRDFTSKKIQRSNIRISPMNDGMEPGYDLGISGTSMTRISCGYDAMCNMVVGPSNHTDLNIFCIVMKKWWKCFSGIFNISQILTSHSYPILLDKRIWDVCPHRWSSPTYWEFIGDIWVSPMNRKNMGDGPSF